MTDTPYRRSAKLYALGGWSPVPMTAGDPAHPKGVPLAGYTGRGGFLIGPDTVDHFMNKQGATTHPNVSLRANGWIGIDVDQGYGGKNGGEQLEHIEAELGPLPPTYMSTARGPGASGIYIYRIPAGIHVLPEGYNFDLYGDSIEVIRREHRYVKCWPTVHPNGAEYRWYDECGVREGDFVPDLRDCAELPAAWLKWLTTDNRAPHDGYAGTIRGDRDTGEERIFCDLLDVERFLDAHRTKAMETEQGAGFNDALNAYAYALGAFVPEFYSETEAWDLCAEICEVHFGTTNAADRATITSALRSAPPFNARRPDPNGNPFGPDGPYLQPARIASHSVVASPAHDTNTPQLDVVTFPFVDWHHLLGDDMPTEEWVVEPILATGRQIVIYSPPKVGKSLLALEFAAAIARGRPVIGDTKVRPRTVLYLDFENAPADIRDRALNMGLDPHDLDRLKYASFPALSKLDTDAGGAELLALAQSVKAEVVIVDTATRTIRGEENSNDTWAAWYTHTGLRLKRAGIALMRLDHTGKDDTRGQRGGSSKSSDVDGVWMLKKHEGDVLHLECQMSRTTVTEKLLVLHRQELPSLHHKVDAQGLAGSVSSRVREVIRLLDKWDIKPDVGVRKVMEICRSRGETCSQFVATEAQRVRKSACG